jgi:DNA-binding XRE family transcriptional regulator
MPSQERALQFSQALFDARAHCKLTQAELGAHLGLTERTIHRWESGVRRPNDRELAHVVRKLHQLAPAHAARIAGTLGTTLEACGIAAPSQSVAHRHALEAAICAAAEELDVSPRRFRPAVAALLARLREARLTIDEASALADAHAKRAPL